MPGSDEETRTITDWRTQSKFYRRRPGLGWLIALLAIPLLLALIGWAGFGRSDKNVELAVPSVNPSATLAAPSVSTPNVNVPSAGFAPMSIVRTGDGFTLAGQVPDLATKTSLLDALKLAMPGATIVDNLEVTPGVTVPDFAPLGGLFSVAADIPDFKLDLAGDTITLTGTAPSEDLKAAAEAAASSTWPNVKIVNDIQVVAASATTTAPASPPPAPGPGPGGPCATLQADISGMLRTPITFVTDGFTLTADSRQLLSQVADKVKACPNVNVAVVGYTDNTGNDGINVPLSGNRAKSVADALVSDGVASDHVTSKGAGSANPVAGNDTPQGRAQNRRVEITVS